MRLLVATDGSVHALRAAALAARLAEELREPADLILVHVAHIPAIAYGAPMEFGPLEEGLKDAGDAIMAQTAQRFGGLDVTVTPLHRRGDPAGEIMKAAEEASADVIVMGSRGLGHLGGLLLGSVSERVLHGARVPVLIVR